MPFDGVLSSRLHLSNFFLIPLGGYLLLTRRMCGIHYASSLLPYSHYSVVCVNEPSFNQTIHFPRIFTSSQTFYSIRVLVQEKERTQQLVWIFSPWQPRGEVLPCHVNLTSKAL
jgi:hypothetical protein